MTLPIAPPELLLLAPVLVGLGPLLVLEEAPELEGWERVEETTEEVAGMEAVAVPSSTW